MESPYIQNPFPPPPRHIGKSLLFFAVAAVALGACGYLIWFLTVGEKLPPPPSAPAPISAARAEIATMAMQCGVFRTSVGRYPTAAEGLDSLVERPAKMPREIFWMKLRTNMPRDPWNNPYQYEEVPGDPPTYRIFSTGPNTTDPADDISQTLPALPPLPTNIAPAPEPPPAENPAPKKPAFR